MKPSTRLGLGSAFQGRLRASSPSPHITSDECDVTHHYHSLLTTPTIDDSPVPPRSPSCRPQGIKTQEWPEHRSHEEQHPKPGTSPSTTQWLEVEAVMPYLVCIQPPFAAVN